MGPARPTTFRMMCGLLNPTCGSILINGFDLRKAKAAVPRPNRLRLAENFLYIKKLTLKQNIEYFAGSYGLYGKEKTERISYLIDDFLLRALLRSFRRRSALWHSKTTVNGLRTAA